MAKIKKQSKTRTKTSKVGPWRKKIKIIENRKRKKNQNFCQKQI